MKRDFFEIEDIFCKGTLNYEYKVRPKVYEAKDDMRLPASFLTAQYILSRVQVRKKTKAFNGNQ